MSKTMPHASEWTYEDYASLPEDGNRYEVIDGVVCMTPAPGTNHQSVGAELYVVLHTYATQHGLGKMLWDVDLLFVTGQYLRPDMLFVPKSGLAGIRERGVESTPDLVVEVLSPHSGKYDRVLKPARYRDFGVPEYWVVDPVAQLVEHYRLSEPANRPIICSETLQWQPAADAPALSLSLPELFERARIDVSH